MFWFGLLAGSLGFLALFVGFAYFWLVPRLKSTHVLQEDERAKLAAVMGLDEDAFLKTFDVSEDPLHANSFRNFGVRMMIRSFSAFTEKAPNFAVAQMTFGGKFEIIVRKAGGKSFGQVIYEKDTEIAALRSVLYDKVLSPSVMNRSFERKDKADAPPV